MSVRGRPSEAIEVGRQVIMGGLIATSKLMCLHDLPTAAVYLCVTEVTD
jgi:hypothetical protein